MAQQNVVQLRGLEALQRKLTPRLFQAAIQGLFRRAVILGERTAKQAVPKDTAALARSITSEVRPTLARVFTTLAYARPVEFGRRPGAKMPPPQALLGWIRRHGFQGSAFVLARAIARRGIKGRFFMRKARSAVRRALPRFIRQASDRIEREWGRG